MSTEVVSSISKVNLQTSSASTAGSSSIVTQSFSEVFSNRSSLSSGSADLDAIFEAAGRRYNISPNLLKAVAQVESNFRPNVTSRAGAQGIMQLMPATARHLGVSDPFDPEQNIMGGARYLRELLDRFDGDISLALASYNAGWPTVMRHGGIPPFAETQAYVPRVLSIYNGANNSSGTADLNNSGAGSISDENNSANPASSAGGANNIGTQNSTSNSNTDTTAALTQALTQMINMRMIEMQMSLGSNNDSTRGFF